MDHAAAPLVPHRPLALVGDYGCNARPVPPLPVLAQDGDPHCQFAPGPCPACANAAGHSGYILMEYRSRSPSARRLYVVSSSLP